MCVNAHDPERIEVRPDGRRVCSACVALYARRSRHHGEDRAVQSRSELRKGAPSHAQPRK